MASRIRFKTKYDAVYYINGIGKDGNPEKIYYIRYYKDGKRIEEKAGRQKEDKMNPLVASRMRLRRIGGDENSNNEKRSDAEAIILSEQNKWTINRLWNEYKAGKPNTRPLRVDDGRYQNYLKKEFGTKEPKEIILLDVERLKRQLLKKLSPQSVKHILGLLKRIINFGFNTGLCENINFKISLPVVDNEKTEDLTQEQLNNLLRILNNEPNTQGANLMKLCLFTGMRRGELFNLQWNDIDFNRGFIKIRDPKGKKDEEIPLNDSARELLKSHEKTKSPYVFPNKKGEKRTDIKRFVNRIKKEAGLPDDFRPLHGLRHFFASQLASSGKVDMYTLQKLMTHKTPRMTQRYAHLRDKTLKDASNIACDLMRSTES
jgi:integrase